MSLENPELGQKYSLSMSWPSDGPQMLYPYAQLPAGSRVVDVGGGSGHITAPIAKQHPHLKFILQDSPDTIAYGKSIYGSEGLPIAWQTTDFLKEQQEKGARVYMMRHILVDWPDRNALQILDCIANAMDKDSRLLICEAIVPDRYGEESDALINVLDLNLRECSSSPFTVPHRRRLTHSSLHVQQQRAFSQAVERIVRICGKALGACQSLEV